MSSSPYLTTEQNSTFPIPRWSPSPTPPPPLTPVPPPPLPLPWNPSQYAVARVAVCPTVSSVTDSPSPSWCESSRSTPSQGNRVAPRSPNLRQQRGELTIILASKASTEP